MSVYELSGSIHEPLLVRVGAPVDDIQIWTGSRWRDIGRQVAAASCETARALRLAVEWMGSDWYADPHDPRDEAAILDEVMEGLRIREVADPAQEAESA